MRHRALVMVLVAGLLALQVAAAQSPVGSQVPLANPTTAADWEHRGDLHMVHKEYAQASDAYLKALRLDPHNAVFLNKAGIAYQQQDRLDLARRYYKRAIKQNGEYADAVNNLGSVYYAERKYKTATREFHKAIQLKPTASAYSNLGTAYFAREMYPEMTDAYNTAVKLDPEVFDKAAMSGTALRQGTPEDRARFHYFVARTFAASGNGEKALQYLRMALAEGFQDREAIRREPAFAELAKTAPFQQLLASPPAATESRR